MATFWLVAVRDVAGSLREGWRCPDLGSGQVSTPVNMHIAPVHCPGQAQVAAWVVVWQLVAS